MLPTDWEYGDWPKSGEIDIMENVGYDPDTIVGSSHTENIIMRSELKKMLKLRVRIVIKRFTCMPWNGRKMSTGFM